MWQSAALRFAADHPTAAGHFPSNPIIPGALILDTVIAAITGAAGTGAAGIPTAKFLRPVRPGESLTLRWRMSGADAASFECALAGGGVAVTGVLELGPVPP